MLLFSPVADRLAGAIAFGGEMAIGREEGQWLSIPEGRVSRLHARVVSERDEWVLEDLNSTNGTWVNGRQISRQRLVGNDIVRIGDTFFRFIAKNARWYSAYRPDGQVIDILRPVHHKLRNTGLIGGLQIDTILDQVTKVAASNLTCLLLGESGSGKELLARALHQASGRKGDFVAVNCAALPATLIESELFGVRKGAFTGAAQDRTGLVMSANRGTLFLDEIGDMPLEAQVKLLRVIQERQVVPVGSTQVLDVDVRFVAATHRDLRDWVEQGRFRGDLFARVSEFTLNLPPLRARIEDLVPLVRHFIQRSASRDLTLSPGVVAALVLQQWPYNVRELESCIRVAVAMCQGDTLLVEHLPEQYRQVKTTPQMKSLQESAPSESELRAILIRYQGNISAVAKELGKERMQIHRWLKRYGINPDQFRG